MAIASPNAVINLDGMGSIFKPTIVQDSADIGWILPPTELDWKSLHSGNLSLKDTPFDASQEIADSVAQLVGMIGIMSVLDRQSSLQV